MYRVRTFLIVATLLLTAFAVQAQDWPNPTKVGQAPSTYQGKPLAQFNTPIASFKGRFLDSSSTSDHLQPLRTLRAKGIAVDEKENRIYVRLGETFVGYDMATFFSTLGSGLKKTPYGERYLAYQHSTYPESGGGWQTYVIDGQDRLFQFDYDDRDYVYVTYSVWGWGILTNTGFSLVHQQLPSGGLIPEVIGSFKAAGKYYVLVSGSEGSEIWDVTNPSSPVMRRHWSDPVFAVSTIRNGSDDIVALATVAVRDGANTAVLDVFRGSDLASGGQPLGYVASPSRSRFTSITNDGLSFWGVDAPVSGRSTRLVQVQFTNFATYSFTTRSHNFSDRKATGIQYGAGYLTLYGEDTVDRPGDDNMWLFKIEGTSTIDEIELNDYPKKAYTGSSTSEYVTPLSLGYTQRFRGGVVVNYGGKDYLIVCAHGIGDVYELEAPDRLSGSYVGVGGTTNPRNLSTESGPFYGDPLQFTSTYGAGTIGVTWNFGNPEGLSEYNVRNVASGQTISHQYAGLTTGGAIQATKTVSVTESLSSSNTDSLTVTMRTPQARIATDGGTVLSSGGQVLAAARLWDGSDGKVESHYVEWSLGGVTTLTTPSSSVDAGQCGPQTVSMTARYVPYTGTGASITPRLDSSKHYVSSATASYNVVAFKPVVSSVSSNSTSITFRNDSQLNAAAYDPSRSWIVTWELRDSGGAVLATETDTSAIGTKDTFVVSKSVVPAAGAKVVMSIDSEETAWVAASCQSPTYANGSAEFALAPPDPKIIKTGCASQGDPCQFTVASDSGKSTVGWTNVWFVDNGSFASGNAIQPSLTAGTHVITVNSTNDFGSASTNFPVTVAAPTCSSAVGEFTISYQGTSSGCVGSGCQSLPREPLHFKANPWGYTFQDCDKFSWSFGDGGTSTEREPNHTFSSNGPHTVRLTVSNTAGPNKSVTTTVQWGSTPPPPPPPTCTKPPANSIFPSYSGTTSGCSGDDETCGVGETIAFTATTWGYNINPDCDSFAWNFGDGTTSTARNPSKTYSGPGTYTVTLTVRNSGGSTSGTATVKVGAVDNCPIAPGFFEISWTGATSGCTPSSGSPDCDPNETVNFKAQPWGYSFQECDQFLWNFGDGTTSTSRAPSHKFPANGGDFIVTLTVTNTKGSKAADPKTITMGIPATPPTSVSFTSASRAKPGEAVTFSATTQGGDPATKFEWNFGDGGTGAGQTVQHTYVAEGNYEVSVKASNSGGSVQVVKQIQIASTLTYLLPVVTHAGGNNNSSWRTDLHVFQPEFGATGAIEVQLDFKGINKKIFFDSSTEIFEDILGEITTADDAGPVFLHSPVPIDMWTRTYNLSSSGVGTYGQLIPAVLLSGTGGSPLGEETFWSIGGLKNISGPDGFRTNLGFVNPTNQRADLTVHIYEEEFGFEVGRFDVSIDPYQLRQDPLTRWFATLPQDKSFSLRIESKNGVGVISYASVIDNISNDPVFIGAVPDSIAARPETKVSYVPGVGRIGAWRSDLAIFNPDGDAVSLTLEFFDQGGVKQATASGIIIPAKGSITVEDLLQSTIFDIQTDMFGTLKVTTSGDHALYPVVFDRTYNDQGPLGTYGQGIQSFPSTTGNAKVGQPAFIPGVRSDAAYSTNLGLLSLGSGATELSLKLLHPIDGRELMVRPYSLSAGQAVILNDALANFFLSSSASGTLRIEVISGGPVWAYASVIDKLTKDPEYVPAVPARQSSSSIQKTVEE